MKKFFIALGKGTAYALTFLLAQLLVSFLFGIFISFSLSFQDIASGSAPDINAFAGQIQQTILACTNLILALSMVLTLLIFFIVVKIRKKNFARETSLVRPQLKGKLLWLMLPAGVALQFFIASMMELLPIPQQLLDSYAEMSGMLEGGSIVWQILAITVFAPLCEEITFRGFVYARLKNGMPVWLAVCLQALAFGLMHGHPLWIAYAFGLGIVLAVCYEAFKSLWAPVLLHFAMNSSSWLMQITPISPLYCAIYLAASALVLAGIAAAVYRGFASAGQPKDESGLNSV